MALRAGGHRDASTSPTVGGVEAKADPRFRSQFRKTELCVFFNRGRCSKGGRCEFAHGEDELKAHPDLSKTSICKAWTQGICKLSADECAFAHGAAELRRTEAFQESPSPSRRPRAGREHRQASHTADMETPQPPAQRVASKGRAGGEGNSQCGRVSSKHSVGGEDTAHLLRASSRESSFGEDPRVNAVHSAQGRPVLNLSASLGFEADAAVGCSSAQSPVHPRVTTRQIFHSPTNHTAGTVASSSTVQVHQFGLAFLALGALRPEEVAAQLWSAMPNVYEE